MNIGKTTLRRKARQELMGISVPFSPLASIRDWLNVGRDEALGFRQELNKNFGIWATPYFEMVNTTRKLRRVLYLSTAAPSPNRAMTRLEKILMLGVVAAGALGFSSTTSAMSSTTLRTSPSTPAGTSGPVLPQPINWLDGIPELNGYRKDALSGPLQYAKDSGYEFAADKDRLLKMVEEGMLVELEETDSLKFGDVSRPYVLPVTAEFVYRIADQYNYGQKCGSLTLKGAARDVKYQQTFSNGSEKSVHPTGMAVDIVSVGLEARCLAWLEATLSEIEAAKRIDATRETSKEAPHYHVTMATHEYEAWLEKRRIVDNPETDMLRTAMFYEGGSNEDVDGYKAIGWVIRNRARSADYPDTIQGVVADGSAGKSNGGCQFSFMCDGKPEDRYANCRTPAGKLTSYWQFKCDMRWEQVTVIAKAVMAETKDPTSGATLYYATWMNPQPHWARSRTEVRADGKTVSLPYGDFVHRPLQIGNHYFGRSRFAGKDVYAGATS